MPKSESLWHPEDMSANVLEKRAPAVHADFSIIRAEIDSLYSEFDKLTKKAPGNKISPLALKNVNAAIEDAKRLLTGDRYVDRVSEFVAAGETPTHSDVLLTLASLCTAFDRFRVAWWETWDEMELS